MKISRQEVEKISELARLELTEDEKEKYGSQLSDILSYIDQLQEVDVRGVEPTAQITGLENKFREDEIDVWDDEERLSALNQAPELEDGQVKVKRVL